MYTLTKRTSSTTGLKNDLKRAITKIEEMQQKHFLSIFNVELAMDDGLDKAVIWLETPIEDIGLEFDKETHQFQAYTWDGMYNSVNVISLDEALSEITTLYDELLKTFDFLNSQMRDKFSTRVSNDYKMSLRGMDKGNYCTDYLK